MTDGLTPGDSIVRHCLIMYIMFSATFALAAMGGECRAAQLPWPLFSRAGRAPTEATATSPADLAGSAPPTTDTRYRITLSATAQNRIVASSALCFAGDQSTHEARTDKHHRFLLTYRCSCRRCQHATRASVLLAGDDGFAAEAVPLNARIRRQPLAILYARSVGDVQAAVKCGLAHGVRVVPQSGGHSYEGAPGHPPSANLCRPPVTRQRVFTGRNILPVDSHGSLDACDMCWWPARLQCGDGRRNGFFESWATLGEIILPRPGYAVQTGPVLLDLGGLSAVTLARQWHGGRGGWRKAGAAVLCDLAERAPGYSRRPVSHRRASEAIC